MSVQQKKYTGLTALGRFLAKIKEIFVQKTDTATSSTAGIAKLYNTTGNNTDGAITQSAATSALNQKLPISGGTLTGNIYTTPYYDSTIEDPEGGQCLVLSKGKTAKGTPPATETEWHTLYMAVDNTGLHVNAHKYGQIETAVYSNGDVETRMQSYRNVDGATNSTYISLRIAADGTAYATVPAISNEDDNSNKPATTAYVKANTTPITDQEILEMFATAFAERSY